MVSKNLTRALAGGAILRSYLAGLTLSTAGSSTTFSVAAGIAEDSTHSDMILLASAMSKTTGAWAAGTGNGALDTGSILASTWYWAFVIKNPTSGAVDIIATKAVAATTPVPTLPSGYTIYRYIGSMKTNGSSQWTKFIQTDDDFYWDSPVSETNFPASLNNTSSSVTLLGVPAGLKVKAFLHGNSSSTGACTTFLWDPDRTGQDSWFVVPSTLVSSRGEVITNTSAQVKFATNAAVTGIAVLCLGYRDTRGRNA